MVAALDRGAEVVPGNATVTGIQIAQPPKVLVLLSNEQVLA
jgi:hypothetical protein